jgi:hypothetical protein
MSCNWELVDTGEIIGTAYCGPNRTLAFQWNTSLAQLQLLDSDLKVVSEDDEDMELGDFLKKMVARPIQKHCY